MILPPKPGRKQFETVSVSLLFKICLSFVADFAKSANKILAPEVVL